MIFFDIEYHLKSLAFDFFKIIVLCTRCHLSIFIHLEHIRVSSKTRSNKINKQKWRGKASWRGTSLLIVCWCGLPKIIKIGECLSKLQLAKFGKTHVNTIVSDTTLYVLYGIRHNHNLVSVSDGGIVMVAMMMMMIINWFCEYLYSENVTATTTASSLNCESDIIRRCTDGIPPIPSSGNVDPAVLDTVCP